MGVGEKGKAAADLVGEELDEALGEGGFAEGAEGGGEGDPGVVEGQGAGGFVRRERDGEVAGGAGVGEGVGEGGGDEFLKDQAEADGEALGQDEAGEFGLEGDISGGAALGVEEGAANFGGEVGEVYGVVFVLDEAVDEGYRGEALAAFEEGGADWGEVGVFRLEGEQAGEDLEIVAGAVEADRRGRSRRSRRSWRRRGGREGAEEEEKAAGAGGLVKDGGEVELALGGGAVLADERGLGVPAAVGLELAGQFGAEFLGGFWAEEAGEGAVGEFGGGVVGEGFGGGVEVENAPALVDEDGWGEEVLQQGDADAAGAGVGAGARKVAEGEAKAAWGAAGKEDEAGFEGAGFGFAFGGDLVFAAGFVAGVVEEALDHDVEGKGGGEEGEGGVEELAAEGWGGSVAGGGEIAGGGVFEDGAIGVEEEEPIGGDVGPGGGGRGVGEGGEEASGEGWLALVVPDDGRAEVDGGLAAGAVAQAGGEGRGGACGEGGGPQAVDGFGGEEIGERGAAGFVAGEAGERLEGRIDFREVAGGIDDEQGGGGLLEEAAVAGLAGADGLLVEAGVGDVENSEKEAVAREGGGAELDVLDEALGVAQGASQGGAAAPDAFPPLVEGAFLENVVADAGALEPSLDGFVGFGGKAQHGAVLRVGVEDVGFIVEQDHAEGGGLGHFAKRVVALGGGLGGSRRRGRGTAQEEAADRAAGVAPGLDFPVHQALAAVGAHHGVAEGVGLARGQAALVEAAPIGVEIGENVAVAAADQGGGRDLEFADPAGIDGEVAQGAVENGDRGWEMFQELNRGLVPRRGRGGQGAVGGRGGWPRRVAALVQALQEGGGLLRVGEEIVDPVVGRAFARRKLGVSSQGDDPQRPGTGRGAQPSAEGREGRRPRPQGGHHQPLAAV